ncbi:MAG: TonB-dependent receptor [Sphingobium sp.]
MNMKRGHLNRFGLFLGSVSFLAFMPWSAAQAQNASVVAADQQAEATPPVVEGGEIVVTANKREQSINKVGLAITAVSGDTLRSQNIVSLADIATTVPGLSYTPSATSTPVYTLRGVGFYETTLAAYPTVSVYVDQIPLPFPALTTHSNFDLERVEVLKGPQGTLFGQNSTGGAINFIAAKPTATFAAGGDLTYGRFNRLEGNAYISGPLTNTLTARLAVTGARADDWQYSYTRKDTTGKVGYYGGRLTLDWKPTDRLNFELTLTGWRDRTDPQAPQYQTLLSQSPGTTVQAVRDYPFAPFNARAADWSPGTPPRADNRFFQPSLRANWEIGDNLILTTITSYADYKQKQVEESDGTALRVDDFYVDDGFIKSFNQEIRLADAGRTRLRWVVGANYEDSHAFQNQKLDFSQISTAPIFGYTGSAQYSDQKMRNYAFFGNAEYEVNEKFTVKAGARYTNARRTAAICTSDPGDGTFSRVFHSLANAIQSGAVPVAGFTPTGKVVPPIGSGCAPLDNTIVDGTPSTYLPGEFRGKLQEHNVSWRAGIDYKPSRQLLLYVNVAKGYKAGSYPIASAATFQQFLPVTQESLLSYEGGFKFFTSDRKLQVTGAGFYYDYSNKQLRSKIIDPIFGILDSLTNIPKSHVYGGEIELAYRPIEGLTLGASGSWLESKVTDFVGFNTAGGTVNFAGAVIPYTPKYQVRFTGDYSWRWGSAKPFIGASVSMRSMAQANIGGAKGLVLTSDFASSVPVADTYKINGYTLVDLRAGASFDEGKYTVTVFGKNVFNKYYVTNIYTDYDTIDRFAGAPATYGVTVAMKFR